MGERATVLFPYGALHSQATSPSSSSEDGRVAVPCFESFANIASILE